MKEEERAGHPATSTTDDGTEFVHVLMLKYQPMTVVEVGKTYAKVNILQMKLSITG